MKRNPMLKIHALVAVAVLASACGASKPREKNPAAEAPPAAVVERVSDSGGIKVDHPEQFPLATAGERSAAPELNVTGVVSPDVSRNVPVISLASGRVVEIHAKIGDEVKKGQLLMRVQSNDISLAFSDYRKALSSEVLSKAQLERAKLLYEKGAIAAKDLEVAQDTEDRAKVDVETSLEHLRVLGVDANKPSTLVDIFAPVSGIITEQNVTAASGVKTLDNSPNLFTISDMSEVWVVCDVYENDLAKVKLGELVDVKLAAYPDRVFKAKVDNLAPVMDPNIHTAKVRLQIQNPGLMKIGMFVTATFHSFGVEKHAVVPASAILHLHDREWVYAPEGTGFKRLEVVSGTTLPEGMQEIVSGLAPGQRVVTNALVLQNTVEQ